MKKLFLLILVLYFSQSNAQRWLWAKAGINTAGQGDPWDMATDNSGNILETGVFVGKINFDSFSVSTTSPQGNAFLTKYNSTGDALWAKCPLISSSSLCFAYSVATDKAGNSFITGFYSDTATFGPYTLVDNNGLSINYGGNTFLVKYDVNGNVIWAKCSKEPSIYNSSIGETVATDLAGNIYLAGFFTDSISFGSYTLTTGNINKSGYYVVKYSQLGTVIWAKKGVISNTFFYISSADQPTICSNGGNIYLSGVFIDTLNFGSQVFTNGGARGNFFLLKFDSSGSIQWGASGTAADSSSVPYSFLSKNPCITDSSGNIYIGGTFNNTLQIGSFMLSDNNHHDCVFLAKYNSSGSVIWAEKNSDITYPYTVNAYGLAVDKWDNIYYSGTFDDSISLGGIKLMGSDNLPSFLIKLDSSGHALCGAAIENYNDDNNAVAIDPLGPNVYFGGDAGDYGPCAFGSNVLNGGSGEWTFIAKWTCDSTEGINDLTVRKPAITLYPNPNNGLFTIESSIINGKYLVNIYNMLGERIYTAKLNSVNSQIDLTDKSAGVYLYRVINENGGPVSSGKFIIQ